MADNQQDIVNLGLNIDSFSPEKLAVLNEYIALFDKLSKYDNKIFNPILGEGLAALNSSLQETNSLLTEINAKMSAIRSVRIAANIDNRGLENASRSMKTFHENSKDTILSLEGVGSSLTKLITNVRYLAFILPGIGIAGIFNLAFTAISNVVEALSGVNDEELKTAQISANVNKSLQEQIKLWNEIIQLEQKYNDSFLNVGSFSGQPELFNSLRNLKEKLSGETSRGYDRGTLLQDQLDVARRELYGAGGAQEGITSYKNPSGGVTLQSQLGELSKDVQTQLQLMNNARAQLESSKGTLSDIQQKIDDANKRLAFGEASDLKKQRDIAKAQADNSEAIYNVQKEKYEQLNSLLENYYGKLQSLNDKQLELDKFNSDEARKLLVKTTEDAVDLNIASQKSILENDQKFYQEKHNAIEKSYKDQVELAVNARRNVTGTSSKYGDVGLPENPNLSATPNDIKEALDAQTTAISKARIERDDRQRQNDVNFYQRALHAQTEYLKDQINADAVAQKAIYTNQEKSLEERLKAYEKYVQDRQKIRSLDYNLSIQRGASSIGGPTSLTPEEQTQIQVHNEEEKKNIAADGEKDIYEIVFSSLKKRLEDEKNLLAQEPELYKVGYTQALQILNQKYSEGLISLEKYHRLRKQIDYKYQKEEIDEQILQDKKVVAELQKTSDDINAELENRQNILALTQLYYKQHKASKEDVDKAQGGVDAAKDAASQAGKAVADAKNKLTNDQLRKEQLEPPDTTKDWKKWVDQAERAADAIISDIQKLYDERIALQEQFLERRKQMIDEEYGYEQKAIEDSSLSLKDKQAQEIKIQSEKDAADKDAAGKEYQLKIKEFEFNKKLELAKAAIGIAAAIIKDGLTTPKSIADAVIGAAEIATIIATQPPAPPSFAEGVRNFEGGLARFGEAGWEIVNAPGSKPYIAKEETISVLPKGTDIIPLNKTSPEFGLVTKDDSWEQTRFLAKQIKKSNREIKNVFKPTIIVNMNFETRKRQILGN